MKAISIIEIPHKEDIRYSSGFIGLDGLLGGGFVDGQCLMFAGEPGVGKSTLITQLCNNFADASFPVLYISGEESLSQIRLRADRLETLNPKFLCSEEIVLEDIFELVQIHNPKFLVLDSLQMVRCRVLKQPAGTPIQMRYCLDQLIHFAKGRGMILIVIGHSTKTGLIAGLLTLQHMVDTVFFMTKEEEIRTVTAKKNRFGATITEWAVKMSPKGLLDSNSPEIKSSPIDFFPFKGNWGLLLTPIYWAVMSMVLVVSFPFVVLWKMYKTGS